MHPVSLHELAQMEASGTSFDLAFIVGRLRAVRAGIRYVAGIHYHGRRGQARLMEIPLDRARPSNWRFVPSAALDARRRGAVILWCGREMSDQAPRLLADRQFAAVRARGLYIRLGLGPVRTDYLASMMWSKGAVQR